MEDTILQFNTQVAQGFDKLLGEGFAELCVRMRGQKDVLQKKRGISPTGDDVAGGAATPSVRNGSDGTGEPAKAAPKELSEEDTHIQQCRDDLLAAVRTKNRS